MLKQILIFGIERLINLCVVKWKAPIAALYASKLLPIGQRNSGLADRDRMLK